MENESFNSQERIVEKVATKYPSPSHKVKLVEDIEVVDMNRGEGKFLLEQIISEIPSSDWFEICKNKSLSSFEKRLAYSIGRKVKNSELPSEKQALWASKALYKMIESGVYTEKWFFDTTKINFNKFLEVLNKTELKFS